MSLEEALRRADRVLKQAVKDHKRRVCARDRVARRRKVFQQWNESTKPAPRYAED